MLVSRCESQPVAAQLHQAISWSAEWKSQWYNVTEGNLHPPRAAVLCHTDPQLCIGGMLNRHIFCTDAFSLLGAAIDSNSILLFSYSWFGSEFFPLFLFNLGVSHWDLCYWCGLHSTINISKNLNPFSLPILIVEKSTYPYGGFSAPHHVYNIFFSFWKNHHTKQDVEMVL